MSSEIAKEGSARDPPHVDHSGHGFSVLGFNIHGKVRNPDLSCDGILMMASGKKEMSLVGDCDEWGRDRFPLCEVGDQTREFGSAPSFPKVFNMVLSAVGCKAAV